MATGLWPSFGLFLFCCGWIGTTHASRYKHYHRVPIIDLNGAEELIGTIVEDERLVSLSPQLRIIPETGPICRYELTSISDSDSDKELPFESKVVNKTEGTVRITLRESTSIDCTNNVWRMQVVAVRCADDSARSEPVTLKITVKDTNNHAPQFEAPWYTFEVEEGKVTEIAHIYATDADCGHPYGKICRYEITNTLDGNPFQIDDQGILSTTLPLNRSQAESHILTIVAHDCGMLHSKSTLVTVHVKQKCVDGIRNRLSTAINGRDDRKYAVNFSIGMGAKRIFSDAVEVVMCPKENACTVKEVDAKVALHLKHKTDIEFETAKQCGLKPGTLELLPHLPTGTSQINELNNDPASIVKDYEATEQKYFFDGKSNAVIVPPETIKQVVPETFTLSFSMKHEAGSKQEQAVKQNLLCESDDFGMNRHHFGVYLRHCKLELLLRREAENAEAEFRAAEWRWDVPAVCDGQWHSYAILFSDIDNVTLIVDGEKFDSTDRNPEILDDWPLHQTKQHKTRLVVGACWHGRNQAMVQFFNGHLSSVFLLTGKVEPESAIKCLHGNRERLSIHSIDNLILGESVVFDHQHNQLSLRANSLKNLSSLLKQIEYVAGDNKDDKLLTGKRSVSISTQVICKENRTIPLGTYEAEVVVVSPSTPQLSVSGLTLISANRRSLKTGSVMLPNLQITVTQNTDGMEEDVTSKHSLEWCKVHLKPSRDMDLEYFSSPAALISDLNVEFEHDKQGIMLKGEESAKSYMEILSRIHYYNTHPETYKKRMYTVHCALQGGKVVSNEFSVTMSIVDDNIEEAIEKLSSLSKQMGSASSSDNEEGEDIMNLEKHFEPSFDQLGANRLQNILEMDLPRPKALLSHHGYEMGGQGAVAGGAVAVVVVICIGFLLVLLVIGVLKMRDSPLPLKRRNRKTTMEAMEWDDQGMNITVNPLEDVGKTQQADIYSEGEESLEDEESYREEDELTEDDDEEAGVLPHNENAKQNGLEWDDEEGSNIPKTYRV